MDFLKSLFTFGSSGVPTEFVLEDHIRGTLYGNAAGDAIGLLTEFLIKEEVKEHYGQYKHYEYDQKVPDFHRHRWAIGDWTDDTDQMIVIMESILAKNGKVDVLDVAKGIKQWSQKGFPELGDNVGMGQGQTTNKVLTHPNFLEDPHMASEFVWDANNRNIAPNGAVMRTSILGVHQYQDIEQVKKNTLDVCKITHADPRCQASCVAVTTAIAMMLQRQPKHVKINGAYDIGAIMKESFQHASQLVPDEAGIALLKEHMFASSLSKLKLCEPGKIGYTYKCMGAGFWALRQNDFRNALEQIVREAGDADTNGAVAGALLGCKLGYGNIPESWRTELKHKDWFEEKLVRFIELVSPSSASPPSASASEPTPTTTASEPAPTTTETEEGNAPPDSPTKAS